MFLFVVKKKSPRTGQFLFLNDVLRSNYYNLINFKHSSWLTGFEQYSSHS